MSFNEALFLASLSARPEDARKFGQIFRPDWLKSAEFRPILAELYAFTQKHAVPPSVDVLRTIFERKDKALYDSRVSNTLDKIAKEDLEISGVLDTLEQAQGVAISWSLQDLFQRESFQSMLNESDGGEIVTVIQKWIQQFEGQSDDIEINIKQAFDDLIKLRGWRRANSKIPCGVKIIDEWTNGGLRPKQLGIMIAPTGHGKSIFLTIVAYKMAAIEMKNVLFITNELSWDEVSERFIALMSGNTLDKVIEDPTVGVKSFAHHWNMGLEGRLRIIDVSGREISTNDIEGMIARYINLYGWRPEVIVLDFMEKMKPTVTGIRRSETWDWYGAIAKDLVRMNKRNSYLTWTAAQTNRGGYNQKNELGLGHAQGSIKHLQESDAIIFMRKMKDLKIEGKPDATILQFSNQKQRQSKSQGETILVEADLGKILITDTYHDMSEWTSRPEDDEEDSNGMSFNYDKK